MNGAAGAADADRRPDHRGRWISQLLKNITSKNRVVFLFFQLVVIVEKNKFERMLFLSRGKSTALSALPATRKRDLFARVDSFHRPPFTRPRRTLFEEK